MEFLLDAALFVAALAAIALGAELTRRGYRRRAGLARAEPWPTQPPSWALTLVVDVDESSAVLRPSVQLRGSGILSPARVRLQLVDENGTIRCTSERSLPPAAIGRQLALPPFAPPDRVSADEALRWAWDVVIEDERGELARWREFPAPAGRLNAEAELDLPGVASVADA
jgi:hypothetical protein